jgi:hypothetical protein
MCHTFHLVLDDGHGNLSTLSLNFVLPSGDSIKGSSVGGGEGNDSSPCSSVVHSSD